MGQHAQYDNPGMYAAEQEKYRKHELAYSHTGYSLYVLHLVLWGPLLFDIWLHLK